MAAAAVSRLVIIGGLPIAVRVLIADAARDGCAAVLLLSPITRLRGRGDTTRLRRPLLVRSRVSGVDRKPTVSVPPRSEMLPMPDASTSWWW